MKDQPRLYPLDGRTATYAGRCDLVARVMGKTYVVDYKTGTRPKRDPYYEWRLQTAAYRNALHNPSYPGDAIEGNAVLHLDKVTGLPTWYDFSNTYELDLQAWNHLIALYRIMLNGKFDPSKEVPSVTSACSALDKSGPLMWWATDLVRTYTLQKVSAMSRPPSFDELADLLSEAQRNYRKVAAEAADIGTQVHACIEQWLRSRVEPKIEDDRVLAGYVAFLEWEESVHLEVIAQEVVVYGN